MKKYIDFINESKEKEYKVWFDVTDENVFDDYANEDGFFENPPKIYKYAGSKSQFRKMLQDSIEVDNEPVKIKKIK